jgi:hypothetical protein
MAFSPINFPQWPAVAVDTIALMDALKFDRASWGHSTGARGTANIMAAGPGHPYKLRLSDVKLRGDQIAFGSTGEWRDQCDECLSRCFSFQRGLSVW